MTTQRTVNTEVRQRQRIVRTYFYLVAMTIVYLAICPSTALGQTNYSDIWGNGDYIYGCGLTEDYYNSNNHTFGVSTILQSPNGRDASNGAGYSSPYARADVYLTFEESDLGDYLIDSQHDYFCPMVSEYYFAGSTGGAAAAQVYEVYYGFRSSTPNPYSGGTICTYQKCEVSPCGATYGQDWVGSGESCPAGYVDKFRKFIICWPRDHHHLGFNPCPSS